MRSPRSTQSQASQQERQREAQLAQQLLEGDDSAFEEFVNRMRKRLFNYAMLMCGHPDDAEEVTQEALLKAFENFHQLRDPNSVRAWIFRIARNECLMKRRKSIFAPAEEISLDEPLPGVEDDGGQLRLEIADWTLAPEDEVFRKELREILKDAIQKLPPTYRSVFLLREVEGLSTRETAEVLGVSEEVVKTRLHRARMALRQQLDDYLWGYVAKQQASEPRT